MDRDTPYTRFRLGNIDSYQGSPSNLDRGEFPKIPIIRIWGAADETGQKVSVFHAPSLLNTQVCCHVHGVYPYCYIEYNRNLIPDEGNYRPFMPKNY